MDQKRLINKLRNDTLTLDELCEEFKTEQDEMRGLIGGLQGDHIPVSIKQSKRTG